jgi:uncharacterized Zn finger protein
VKDRRPRTDKELIAGLATELGLEIMAIRHVYRELKEQLQLNNTKEESKNYISAQIYQQIENIDLELDKSDDDLVMEGGKLSSSEIRQKWYQAKLNFLAQLAKIENIETKSNVNNTTIQGSVNTKNETTIEKQVVMAENEAMVNLLNKILPQNTQD